MATPTKKAPAKAAAPKAAPVITVQEVDESTLRRVGEEQVSPLLEHVRAALDDGKAKGVGVTKEYPATTIYTHLRKAERQLKLQDDGKKLRIWDKTCKPGTDEPADWPHMAFKVIPIPEKKSK